VVQIGLSISMGVDCSTGRLWLRNTETKIRSALWFHVAPNFTIYVSAASNKRPRHYVLGSSVVRPSVIRDPLTPASSKARSLYSVKGFISCEWKLLKRYPRSDVKGQVVCMNAITAEAYISTMWP